MAASRISELIFLKMREVETQTGNFGSLFFEASLKGA